MADFTKHRLAVHKYPISFVNALNDGDTVASISDVEITKRVTGAWVDKSSEFGDPTGSLATPVVTVELGEAGDGEQDAGSYRIFVRVVTAGGEKLVATPKLEVTEFADPDAP